MARWANRSAGQLRKGEPFQWPGSGQIYSSSRDMATFVAANLGELPGHGPIENAMAFAHQGVFTVSPRLKIGLAWQIVSAGNFTIIDKNGGLPNTSTYIGFAPRKKLGVVILVNRGKQHATGIGRQIIHALAQDQSEPSNEGEPNPDNDEQAAGPRASRHHCSHGPACQSL